MAPPKKNTGPQRSRHSSASWMQTFLQQPELLGKDSNPDPVFVQALMLCHERFLHVVAAELVAAHRSKGDAAGNGGGGGGIHRINSSSVEAAMRELGMEDLLQQAQQSMHTTSSVTSKKLSKGQRKRKNRQFTEEQIEEQERLLASSKNKVVQH